MDYFICTWQPKLVINNIEVLKNAILMDGDSSVCGSMYHDSLIWRIIALGANERCLPVLLVTSDRLVCPFSSVSSYSYLSMYQKILCLFTRDIIMIILQVSEMF